MENYISKAIRKLVIERAGNRCEYCRVPAFLAGYDFQIDHVIAIQHGGLHLAINLAYCCPFCNKKKGPNIATLSEDLKILIPLFNPRTQNWFDHFYIENGEIIGKTDIGKATIRLLEMNKVELIIHRAEMMKGGFFP